ncbi:cytochrome P450, putative [Perkinsus marinus ATCC 50983]|uniref:Cytochrome P450, putative n=1 Tax=Perkinsus marinus (strain ATCC 50983 / TXsc) TaxID=423536 RepID=C5LHQ4_PERM5|nr:cytochrome P450, putative [Perkinsus marinus ATCC 50983]EER03658.1 cytochrome P450, putative [Perkinsus marinus ATCC 50983]|eukprot:XP_002771842.1 cytochrome P450, putative [Perkinsus marinus ATCC 50983]
MDSVSMAMSEGDTWKRHRRAASRPLAETNLDKLVPMIIRLGEDMVGKLKQLADEKGVITWKPVNDVQLLGMRVAAAVYMGETDPLSSEYALFSHNVQGEVRELIMHIFSISLKPSRILYHDRLIYRLLFPGVRESARKWRGINSKLLEDIRRNKKAAPRDSDLPKSVPRSSAGQLNETELSHNLIMYLGAGGETAASAIVRLMQYFCKFPEIQTRARAEATSIRELSAHSVYDMPYIEACLMETIRLNPSPPMELVRALVDCKVAGKPVKAGTKLIFPLTQIQRKVYTDGDEFRPERWLVPGAHSIDEKLRTEFVGFGFGPRQCPGRYLAVKEVVTIIALLLPMVNKMYPFEDSSEVYPLNVSRDYLE